MEVCGKGEEKENKTRMLSNEKKSLRRWRGKRAERCTQKSKSRTEASREGREEGTEEGREGRKGAN